jgi:hypothetical protein
MEVLTTDGRRLTIVKIGNVDSEQGSNQIVCYDETKQRVSIVPADIVCFYGSYVFFANTVKK